MTKHISVRDTRIKEAAYQLLIDQRTTLDGYTFTTPSKQYDPYNGRQWFWDSCFHAYISADREPDIAKSELMALLAHQRQDGFIPHMNYFSGNGMAVHGDASALLDQFWSSKYRSDIIQPPIIAMSVKRIFDKTQDKDFLSQVLPKLARYYDYLNKVRDPEHSNLLSIIHSWESGWDNSQRWDKTYDVKTGSSDEVNQKKIQLFKKLQDMDWDESRILSSNVFNVKPVDFNVLYAHNLKIMAELCEAVEGDGADYRRKSENTTDAIFSKMFNGEFFCDILADGSRSIVRSAAMFYPMLLSRNFDYSSMITDYLTNPNEFYSQYGIRTINRTNSNYAPNDYWRGNIWINVNWLIIKGLQNQNYDKLAHDITNKILRLVDEHGFWEYYNPETGEGHRAQNLGWDALVYDLI